MLLRHHPLQSPLLQGGDSTTFLSNLFPCLSTLHGEMFMAPSWSCSSVDQNESYLTKLKFWLHVMLYYKDLKGFSFKNKIFCFFFLIRPLYLLTIIAHFFIPLLNTGQQWLKACSSSVWNHKNHTRGQRKTEYPVRYNHAEKVTEKQRKRKEDKIIKIKSHPFLKEFQYEGRNYIQQGKNNTVLFPSRIVNVTKGNNKCRVITCSCWQYLYLVSQW